jgi:TRAP-type C4-dicarboxylate transport system permease large subunit
LAISIIPRLIGPIALTEITLINIIRLLASRRREIKSITRLICYSITLIYIINIGAIRDEISNIIESISEIKIIVSIYVWIVYLIVITPVRILKSVVEIFWLVSPIN